MQCILFFNSKILSYYLFRYLFFAILSFSFPGYCNTKILLLLFPSSFVSLVHDFLRTLDVSCVFISLFKHLKHIHIKVSVILFYEVNVTWTEFIFDCCSVSVLS